MVRVCDFFCTFTAMNYKWNFVEPTSEQQETANELAEQLGISPILGRLLVNRGIEDVWEARRFFHPQLSELLDPFLGQGRGTP